MTGAPTPDPPPARLRRVAEALVAGVLPDGEDGRLVGERLLAGLDGGGLDRALGLVAPRPGPSPLRQGRWAERDRLLRELAGLYGGGPTARAAEMSRDLRNYASVGWSRDKARGSPWPDSPKRSLMFAVHSADPDRPPPTGIVRLLAILRGD